MLVNRRISLDKSDARCEAREPMNTQPSISEAMQAVPVMFDIPAEGTGLIPVGEVQLTADLSSMVPLPYAPGQSRVMGDMLKDGAPWACCPRSFLKRMIARAKQMRLAVQGAFENEFYLLKNVPGKVEPVDNTTFASTYAMDISADVIEDIVQALTAQGITVEQVLSGVGAGPARDHGHVRLGTSSV